jgi:homoserine O-acetyltransferase
VDVAYETYGELNAARSNAILISHAFSGDAHCAGISKEDGKPGWWDNMIGPGKAFDTDLYFVLCANVLGGCKGTTGPSSVNPATGSPYAMAFPVITLRDMVRLQKMLVDHLGIERLLGVAGGSMGGMQALQWAASYPTRVRSVIALATTTRHSAQQIAFNEIARRSVTTDPNWRGGDYHDGNGPRDGLAVARMLGHVTYLSDGSMQRRFGRRRCEPSGGRLDSAFEVGRYLDHQGRSFVERFDARAFVLLTRAIDLFDLERDGRSLAETFGATDAAFLLLTFSSDWLYPPRQLERVAEAAREIGKRVSYHEIASDSGHDAFLLEHEAQAPIIRDFLRQLHDARPVLRQTQSRPGRGRGAPRPQSRDASVRAGG